MCLDTNHKNKCESSALVQNNWPTFAPVLCLLLQGETFDTHFTFTHLHETPNPQLFLASLMDEGHDKVPCSGISDTQHIWSL